MFSINECIHPCDSTTSYTWKSPTISVSSLNTALYFQTHQITQKATKLQPKVKWPWDTFFLPPAQYMLLFLLRTNNIVTIYLFLYWTSDISIPTSMCSITESCQFNLRNFPQTNSPFPFCYHGPSWGRLHWLKSSPTNFSPLLVLPHTVASLSFLESKSVIVTPFLKHVSWLPIAWWLNPHASGLILLIQTGFLGRWKYKLTWTWKNLWFSRTLCFLISCSTMS